MVASLAQKRRSLACSVVDGQSKMVYELRQTSALDLSACANTAGE